MQLTAVFKALQYIVFLFLCLAVFLAVPCSSNLLCLSYNNSQYPGLLRHPIRHHYNESDLSSVTMVAATKAHLSPVVFRGTLLSVLVQRDGTVKATFSMDQAMKVNIGNGQTLSRDLGQLEVVYLRRKMNTGEPCTFDVHEENLKLGTSYVVFGRPRNGEISSVTATAFPIPYEKRTFRAIRKVVCKGCAKPPRIEGLKNVRIVEKRKLRLQCHISGNPIPWVTWYKDGQRLDGSGRVRVRTKRRTSRLMIRHVRLRDRGVYECRAVNIVQKTPVFAKAIVTVAKKKTTKKPNQKLKTITTTADNFSIPSLWPIGNCPNSDFCLNGGTCVFYKDVMEYVCHCADGFVGHRCDFKDVRASYGGVKIFEDAQNRLFITVVVLFIVLSCFNWGSLIACWLCCFKTEKLSWKKAHLMPSLSLVRKTLTRKKAMKVEQRHNKDLSTSNVNDELEFKDGSFFNPDNNSTNCVENHSDGISFKSNEKVNIKVESTEENKHVHQILSKNSTQMESSA